MTILLICLVPLAILSFSFIGIPYLTYILSGWGDFAARYPAREQPHGDVWPGETLHFNSTRFKRSFHFYVCDKGLFLCPGFFLKLFFKSVFIPWSAVSHFEQFTHLRFTFNKLEIGSPAVATLRFRDAIPVLDSKVS